jgi:hypothetical protein
MTTSETIRMAFMIPFSMMAHLVFTETKEAPSPERAATGHSRLNDHQDGQPDAESRCLIFG